MLRKVESRLEACGAYGSLAAVEAVVLVLLRHSRDRYLASGF